MAQTHERVHRIEIVNASQRVRVERDGVVLAETTRPVLLHDSHVPTRYYIAPADVCMALLEPSDARSHCPFKGDASYWSARIGDEIVTDLAWSYGEPIEGAEAIAGLICFYNEKVDIDVDGERLERPTTRWS